MSIKPIKSIYHGPYVMSKPMTWEEFQLWKEQFEIFGHHLAQDMTQTMSESSESTENLTSKQSKVQVGGEHYKKCSIQPWDFVIANDLDYFQGSIIKYVTRWKDKGWIQDLHKAKHFLDKYIETMEEKHKNLKERPE